MWCELLIFSVMVNLCYACTGLECPCINDKLRLVRGTGREAGRGTESFSRILQLNVQHNWYNVCVSAWTQQHGRVVCRALGYPAFQGYQQTNTPITRSTMKYATPAECQGGEVCLSQCQGHRWEIGTSGCYHGNEINIVCRDKVFDFTTSNVVISPIVTTPNTPFSERSPADDHDNHTPRLLSSSFLPPVELDVGETDDINDSSEPSGGAEHDLNVTFIRTEEDDPTLQNDHHTSTTNLTMNDAGSPSEDQSLTDQDQHQVAPELEGSILSPQNRSCNSSACREDESVSYVECNPGGVTLYADWSSAVLTSPGYPYHYDNTTVCLWTIEGIARSFVYINITDVEFESDDTSLLFFISPVVHMNDITLRQEITGTINSPRILHVDSYRVFVMFRAQSPSNKRGFRLTYEMRKISPDGSRMVEESWWKSHLILVLIVLAIILFTILIMCMLWFNCIRVSMRVRQSPDLRASHQPTPYTSHSPQRNNNSTVQQAFQKVLKINRFRLSQTNDKELILSADLTSSQQSLRFQPFANPVKLTSDLPAIEPMTSMPATYRSTDGLVRYVYSSGLNPVVHHSNINTTSTMPRTHPGIFKTKVSQEKFNHSDFTDLDEIAYATETAMKAEAREDSLQGTCTTTDPFSDTSGETSESPLESSGQLRQEGTTSAELETIDCSSITSMSSYELYPDINSRNTNNSHGDTHPHPHAQADRVHKSKKRAGIPIYQRARVPTSRRKPPIQSAWSPPMECSGEDDYIVRVAPCFQPVPADSADYKSLVNSAATYIVPHGAQTTCTDISTATYVVPDPGKSTGTYTIRLPLSTNHKVPDVSMSNSTYVVDSSNLNSSTSTYTISKPDMDSSTSTYTVGKQGADRTVAPNSGALRSDSRSFAQSHPGSAPPSQQTPQRTRTLPAPTRRKTVTVQPQPSQGSPTHSRNSSRYYVDNDQTDGTPDRLVKRTKHRKKKRVVNKQYSTGESTDTACEGRRFEYQRGAQGRNKSHHVRSRYDKYQPHNRFVDVPPNDLTCPLTGTLLVHPVIAPDGLTYERDAIYNWLERHSYSPVNQITMTKVGLKTDNITKIRLKKWRKEHSA